MDERDLILKAQAGDRGAFGELVGLYQARLRAYAARYVERGDDVFDIVQDTFLDALQNVQTFDAQRELAPWLRGICRNRILNYFRARKVRRQAHLAQVDAALEERLGAAQQEAGDGVERIEELRRCLGQLDERTRVLIRRRYEEGTSIQDLSGDLRRSAASVSILLLRVRAVLLKCMTRKLAEQNP